MDKWIPESLDEALDALQAGNSGEFATNETDRQNLAGEKYIRYLESQLKAAEAINDALVSDVRNLIEAGSYDHERVYIRRLKAALDGNPTKFRTTREAELEAKAARVVAARKAAKDLSARAYKWTEAEAEQYILAEKEWLSALDALSEQGEMIDE